MPGKELSSPCMDCRDNEAIFLIRSRRLCRDCYTRFVGYKVLRRTEQYRLRKSVPGAARGKLLLPLSCGLASSVLLHMIHTQMKEQRSRPHAPDGFDLHVLIIDPQSISSSNLPLGEALESLQQRFPLASFTQLSLHTIWELVPDLRDVFPGYAGEDFRDDSSLSPKERLDAFRASISSNTSAADVDSVLLTRLIVAFAKSINCFGIIWGDSDDRLAAKTLASVAKGRGSSLTWQVSDGMTPFGLEFSFPLRDLFTAELQNYADSFSELADIIIPDAPFSDNILTKNLSIDQLMLRYVSSQGAKYPGVMSNVTRTANKLQASRMSTNGSRCALCDTFICNSKGVYSQTPRTATTDPKYSSLTELCYACDRSRPALS
ncbi:hypothetical protein BJX68DRAFT_36886 [Aspergillus pseudodeflectus]|uniref:Cytoplasmic tRNA 2-thiolation protein 2 n=1 Tax=Aspergillus pseudodeflectus TaxID=176178 RepID=A0ABR4JBA3_9EURO